MFSRAASKVTSACNQLATPLITARGYAYDSAKTKALRKYREQTKAIRKSYISYVEQKVATETKIKEEQHSQFLSKVEEYKIRREKIKTHNFEQHQKYMAILRAEYDSIRELKTEKRRALESLASQRRTEGVRRLTHESRYFVTPLNIDEHLAIQLQPYGYTGASIFRDQRRLSSQQLAESFIMESDAGTSYDSEGSPLVLSDPTVIRPESLLSFDQQSSSTASSGTGSSLEDSEDPADVEQAYIEGLQAVNTHDIIHNNMLHSGQPDVVDDFLKANQHAASQDSGSVSLETKSVSSALNSILMQDRTTDAESYKLIEGIKASITKTPLEDIMDTMNEEEKTGEHDEVLGADQAIEKAIREYKKRNHLRRAQQQSEIPTF